MNLKHWCELDELIYISETDEEYKQYAGLNYNEKLIEQLAELKISNSKNFINFFSSPRPLLIGAIEDIFGSSLPSLPSLPSSISIAHIRNFRQSNVL